MQVVFLRMGYFELVPFALEIRLRLLSLGPLSSSAAHCSFLPNKLVILSSAPAMVA